MTEQNSHMQHEQIKQTHRLSQIVAWLLLFSLPDVYLVKWTLEMQQIWFYYTATTINLTALQTENDLINPPVDSMGPSFKFWNMSPVRFLFSLSLYSSTGVSFRKY